MKSVFAEARTVASTRATVLLTGETGVGKGVIARLIHRWSNREDEPFVAVHCGAIPDTLLESELFGHEKGSFTGAHRRRKGKFELANGGTLFLDEVGTITPAAQIKLLDVLQEQRFHRVGGEQDVDVDVRIIAASNLDLEKKQREKTFRADLYYRLSVFPIGIPPLRERREDLPLLVDTILASLNALHHKRIEGLDPAVMRAFQSYDWPGNIRELQNVLERALILESTTRISPARIPHDLLDRSATHLVVPLRQESGKSLAEVRGAAIAAAEQRYLERVLATHQGRIDASAQTAGITTRQLNKLMSKYRIDKADFKPERRAREAAPKPEAQAGEAES